MKNYYEILGIKRNANQIEIRTAYRKLAVKFHPDKNENDPFYVEKFKTIQEAYQTLSNDDEKVKYDSKFDNHYDAFKNYNDFETKTKNYEQEEFIKKDTHKTENEKFTEERKNAQLQFEDKAWIFVGNWFIIPGAVGLFMFAKYRSEGYINKSNEVCSLSIKSFIAFLIFAIILFIGSVFAK